MTDKRKVDVVIDGRNFTVIGESSKEYMEVIAKYVDKKIKEVTKKNEKLDSTMSAILAAYNISDEYYRTYKEMEDLKAQAKESIEKYENMKKKLEKYDLEVDKIKKDFSTYKDELLKAEEKNEKNEQLIERYQKTLKLKEKDLAEGQKMIKKLQSKLFSNQLELLQAKKELEKTLKHDDKNEMLNK